MNLYKISKRASTDERVLIDTMKEILAKDPVVKKMFKDYDVDIDKLHDVNVSFKNIDVSAKTVNKKIILNQKLLKTDMETIESYLVHELTHYLQQLTNNIDGHNSVSDYLDKPTEEEAFRAQVEFKKDHEGKQKTEKYVDDLLDYHDLKGKEKKEKKKELMKGI